MEVWYKYAAKNRLYFKHNFYCFHVIPTMSAFILYQVMKKKIPQYSLVWLFWNNYAAKIKFYIKPNFIRFYVLTFNVNFWFFCIKVVLDMTKLFSHTLWLHILDSFKIIMEQKTSFISKLISLVYMCYLQYQLLIHFVWMLYWIWQTIFPVFFGYLSLILFT